MNRFRCKILLFLMGCFLILPGCKTELYSNLNEKDANEMLAYLLDRGIETEKQAGKEMTYTLMVDQKKIAAAVDVLHQAGLPRDGFDSLGEIFKKEGFISSPLEERVRYIYALSQEISQTLSKIDGVLSARVHVVIPDNNPLSDSTVPSSASVFIKYRPDSNIESNIPGIKKLVVNSIEGLTYDKVTVVLFEATDYTKPVGEAKYAHVLTMKVAPDSVQRLRILLGGILLLLAASWALAGYIFLAYRKKEKAPIRG